ncbi:hypothetical protein [Parasutterella sp.]|uniref:hypothetical protein n=1 Tax=Parasutterella sp. TaxID=2049037 RepID=UPI00352092EE
MVIRKNACGSPRTRAEHELILERKKQLIFGEETEKTRYLEVGLIGKERKLPVTGKEEIRQLPCSILDFCLKLLPPTGYKRGTNFFATF